MKGITHESTRTASVQPLFSRSGIKSCNLDNSKYSFNHSSLNRKEFLHPWNLFYRLILFLMDSLIHWHVNVNVQLQKISIPTARKIIGNTEGWRVPKAKMFKGKYESKLEFQRGGEMKPLDLLWEVPVSIFSGKNAYFKLHQKKFWQCFFGPPPLEDMLIFLYIRFSQISMEPSVYQ